jgi:Flp pilus assembly protein TadD
MKEKMKITVLVSTLLFTLGASGCSDLFTYGVKSPVKRLLPAEIYEVPIDQNLDAKLAAKSYFSDQKFVYASAYFEDALKKNPDDREALLGLGSSFAFLGQFRQSNDVFNKYKTKFGEDLAYLNDYGFSSILEGELVRAEGLLLAAKYRDQNSETINNNLRAIRLLRGSKGDLTNG